MVGGVFTISMFTMLCLVSTVIAVNISDCVTSPAGRVTLDVVGVPGPEGPKGDQGGIGIQGVKGQKGAKGYPGDRGPVGVQGHPGLTGEQGHAGDRGQKGRKGAKGYPGDRGPVGVKGHRGVTGEPGHAGDKGQKGRKGDKGYVGDRGPVGVQGHQGVAGEPGHTGDRGQKGQKGDKGAIGQSGLPGAIGPRGYPGDTALSEDEFRKVTKTVQMNISSQLNDINTFIQDIKSTFTKCGIYSLNWRRVTYIDTTQGAACPDGLREVTNSTLNKRACGKTVNVGCSSLTFPSGGSYTHVCGRARGYQFYTTDAFRAFHGNTINDAYVDGLSITRGSPRKHVWSYVAGHQKKKIEGLFDLQCPCAVPGYNNTNKAPFVGDDYYCESGFHNSPAQKSPRIAWEDPLWDGEGCAPPNNTCCQRSGWFHKEVPPTTDNIEVRWCCDESRANEDFYTDIVEIWVL